MNKRILLAYKAYPFAIASYFRRALERRGDVELVTLGECFGQFIPWAGGMEVPYKYLNHVDIPLERGTDRPTWESVRSIVGDVDVIINVDAGFHLSTKPDKPYVVIGTDPHVLVDWYDHAKKFADVFYTMQTSYQKDGDKRSEASRDGKECRSV